MMIDSITQKSILETLDSCANDFTFPVLDNGYVYLAESRLTVFRSPVYWAITIEIFGFSPRAGDPDVTVYTFSNALRNRSKIDDYVSKEAYDNYLANNKFNEFSSFWPIGGENWIDPEDSELCMEKGEYELRNKKCALPGNLEYETAGIKLEEDRPAVFEFCRYLAHHEKELVLATEEELMHHVPVDCDVKLQLSDWCHPDITGSELPSSKETFQLIASLIETDKLSSYSSIEAPNTHWSNWPDSGTL
jgi:hypothetical protein